MPSTEAIETAEKVLSEARMIDPRMRGIWDDEELVIQPTVWAEILENQIPDTGSALKAVWMHYQRPDAEPIMPGDVIANSWSH